MLNASDDDSNTVSAIINVHNRNLTVAVLFDTGALQGNYVNKRTADWLRTNGATVDEAPCRVCSAFNECVLIKNNFNFNIRFKNLANNTPSRLKYEREAICPPPNTHESDVDGLVAHTGDTIDNEQLPPALNKGMGGAND